MNSPASYNLAQAQLDFFRANVAKATVIIELTPEDKIDLMCYGEDRDCGTMFGALGWIVQDKHFIDLGFSIKPLGGGTCRYYIESKDDLAPTSEAVDRIFGPYCYSKLFTSRKRSGYDSAFLKQNPKATDKEIALNRLRLYADYLSKAL